MWGPPLGYKEKLTLRGVGVLSCLGPGLGSVRQLQPQPYEEQSYTTWQPVDLCLSGTIFQWTAIGKLRLRINGQQWVQQFYFATAFKRSAHGFYFSCLCHFISFCNIASVVPTTLSVSKRLKLNRKYWPRTRKSEKTCFRGAKW